MDDLLTFLLSALILFGGIIGFFCLVNYLVNNTPKAKQERAEQERAEKIDWENRLKYFKENNVPEENVYYMNVKMQGLNYKKVYFWMFTDGNWHFLDYDYNNKEINLCLNKNNIIYYKQEGEHYIETTVEGGGINKKGLVGGAIIGGAVGAVIGSKEKIQTKYKEIDNRQICIYYKENNETKFIIAENWIYENLRDKFPDKEYDFIQTQLKMQNA